jgi:hypothetical protein
MKLARLLWNSHSIDTLYGNRHQSPLEDPLDPEHLSPLEDPLDPEHQSTLEDPLDPEHLKPHEHLRPLEGPLGPLGLFDQQNSRRLMSRHSGKLVERSL